MVMGWDDGVGRARVWVRVGESLWLEKDRKIKGGGQER